MSDKRTPSSSDETRSDQEQLSAQANDELAVMGHAAAFDDPIALEHDALAASAEEKANERRLRAMSVLRRGFSQSPELVRGLRLTVLFAIIGSVGRLIIPVLIQQVIDKGLLADEGFRPGFTITACSAAAVIVILVMLLARVTYVRLVTTAEMMLRNLRVRTFAHIHRLSIADHESTRRGELTSRVTSDIETIARFVQYGAVAWIIDSIVVIGTLIVMSFYAWQLAVITIVAALPVLPLFRLMQRRQLKAYTVVRNRVGTTLSEVSEAVQGACLLYTSPSPRDRTRSRMPSSA